jgi:hypothetical protein
MSQVDFGFEQSVAFDMNGALSERDARRLLDQELDRWLVWNYDDWIDMCETDPEDEDDADLFFYLAEYGDDAFNAELLFGPSEEGVVSIELIITIGEDDREAFAAWEVRIDGGKEILEKEVDPEDEP